MHFFLATIHVAPLNLMTKLTISFQYIFIKISTQMLFGSKSQRAFVFGAKIPSVDKSTQARKACFGTLLRSRRLYYIQ